MIHGDRDTDVPYEQSLEMAAALEQHYVSQQLLTVKGSGHGFDDATDARQDPVVSRVFDQVVEFLRQHCLE